METLKAYKIWAIVLSVCMMILGIVMILWPGMSAMTVCCIMGILCIVLGIYEIIRYYKLGIAGLLFRYDHLIGILSIFAGILLLCHPLGAMTILPIILGFYIIVAGAFAVQISTEAHRFWIKDWWKALIFGIAGIVFGMLMIMNPFSGAAALMIFIGVGLLFTGLENIYVFHCISKTFDLQQ